MAFEIKDFRDLVDLLTQHPELRAPLRALLLSEELLALPAHFARLMEAQRRLDERIEQLATTMRELTAAQLRTEQRLEELAQAQARTEQRVEELAQAQLRTEQRVEELAQAQARTEQRVEELAQALRQLEKRIDQLAEAQLRTEQRVEELAQAQARTEQRVEELAQALRQLEKRVDQLAEAQLRTEQRVEELAQAQLRTEQRLRDLSSEFRGDRLERKYRDRAPAYFGKIIRRARVVSVEALDDLLPETSDEFSDEEREQLFAADLIVRGVEPTERTEVYLVVEISVVVDLQDVTRALDRAQLLAKVLGKKTIPVVAGERITRGARAAAAAQGVWCVLDGRAKEPAAVTRPPVA
jgi:DNA repair exonuclease SbcCD ATPase subunit